MELEDTYLDSEEKKEEEEKEEEEVSLEEWKSRWAFMRDRGFSHRFPPTHRRGPWAILTDEELKWPSVNSDKGVCLSGEYIIVFGKNGKKVDITNENRGTKW